MTRTLKDLDSLNQNISRIVSNNQEKRQQLHEKLTLFISQLKDYEKQKYDPLIHAALETINAASGMIIGLEEEVVLRTTETDKGEKFSIVNLSLIEKKHKLLEKAVVVVQKQTVKLKSNKYSRKISGDATAKLYKYITEVAIEITKQYAQKHPHRLNESICIRGVKAEIDRNIWGKMSDPVEYRQANLISPPEIKTVTKHRKIAFKELGY